MVVTMATKAQCLHLTAAMLCISLVLPSFADLQRFEHLAKADGRLSFLVVGDWGRRGFYNQSEVALQVQKPLFFFIILLPITSLSLSLSFSLMSVHVCIEPKKQRAQGAGPLVL